MDVIDKLRELVGEGRVGDPKWDEIDEILDAYNPEGYEVREVSTRHGASGRWTTSDTTVCKVAQLDGKVAHFAVWREFPATEMQEGGDFAYSMAEVVPREVTVIKYVPGRAA